MAGLKGLEGMLTKAASSSGLQVNYVRMYIPKLTRYKNDIIYMHTFVHM